MSASRIYANRRALLAGVALLPLLVAGCLSLTPIQAMHQVTLSPPQEMSGDYQVDPVDESVTYVREGLRLRVHHLTARQLDDEIDGEENPFVYREVDYEKGYLPQRFTVFQVTVNNPTFDKVLLQPEHAYLITDAGQILRPYALTRADADGHPRNFETYFLSRGVQSGNQQKLYLERMAVLRGSIYQRDNFIFKGKSYSGKLVFDPLPVDTEEVTLHLERFVLEFGIYDVPETQLDLTFPFSVRSRIVEDALAQRQGAQGQGP